MHSVNFLLTATPPRPPHRLREPPQASTSATNAAIFAPVLILVQRLVASSSTLGWTCRCRRRRSCWAAKQTFVSKLLVRGLPLQLLAWLEFAATVLDSGKLVSYSFGTPSRRNLALDERNRLPYASAEITMQSSRHLKFQSRTSMKTLKAKRQLSGHANWVTALAFDQTGKTLASASMDQTIKLWEVPRGRELSTFTMQQEYAHWLWFASGGLVSAIRGTTRKALTVWDVAKGTSRVLVREDHASSWAITGDGNAIAFGTSTGGLELWDAATGNRIAILLKSSPTAIVSLAFSPDGKTLASGSVNGTLKLWSCGTRKERATLEGHSGHILSLVFSPNGRCLASGGSDGILRLWSTATAEQDAALSGHAKAIWSLSFTPDGRRLISGSADMSVRLWNISATQQEALLRGHTEEVHAVCCSPDSRVLATGGYDNAIRLWDIQDNSLSYGGHNSL